MQETNRPWRPRTHPVGMAKGAGFETAPNMLRRTSTGTNFGTQLLEV